MPLHPTDAVLWQDQMTPPILRTGGPLPRHVDTVVVGAGYAGIAAARTLASTSGRTTAAPSVGAITARFPRRS